LIGTFGSQVSSGSGLHLVSPHWEIASANVPY
jgi:hypothetical protein